MNDDIDRFTMWQYRMVRRIWPAKPRRFNMREMDLKMKELQIWLFFIVVGGSGAVLATLM